MQVREVGVIKKYMQEKGYGFRLARVAGGLGSLSGGGTTGI
jgi:hypothetical protein